MYVHPFSHTQSWATCFMQGKEYTFTEIVNNFQTPVYNLCYRMLGNSMAAEDAAQETFLRASRYFEKYDPQKKFINWLLSIASHYCIDQLRREKWHRVTYNETILTQNIRTAIPAPENHILDLERTREVHSLLEILDEKDRAIVILYYWYDFSCAEIGQNLSLSTSSVKSRLYRSRRKMAGLRSKHLAAGSNHSEGNEDPQKTHNLPLAINKQETIPVNLRSCYQPLIK